MKAIHVLRKPLVGTTVAGNVLKFGCGGLNIDAARIGTAIDKTPAPKRRGESSAWFTTNHATNVGGDDTVGRWPANLVLQHLDGCKEAGVREDSFNTAVPGTFGVQTGEKLSGHVMGMGSAQLVNAPTTTPAYECAPGCPVDAQSGVSTSTGGRASIGAFKGGRAFGVGNGAEVLLRCPARFGRHRRSIPVLQAVLRLLRPPCAEPVPTATPCPP